MFFYEYDFNIDQLDTYQFGETTNYHLLKEIRWLIELGINKEIHNAT